MPYFSLIIPVYNRPDEIKELLESLTLQTDKNFEVIVVEDGSTISSEGVVCSFEKNLSISYYFTPNGGPGKARNYGATKATGEYLIVLDSDCIIPPHYIENVTKELKSTNADAFGGPDRAADNFTPVQKAINYSMTSFFTTGGIRGGKKKMDKFYPRSFNMGIRRSVYEQLGGFANMRFGEDIDFSIRLYNANYKVCLFPSAWVYHKRRTDWRKFFRQVYNSGIARINLYLKYPESLKPVHLLPAAFTVGVLLLIVAGAICAWFLAPILLYIVLLFADATIQTRSLKIGFLSIIAAFVQLTGYGSGFLYATWRRLILKKNEFSAFNKNFYK
ncbi:glycosyltransferase [Paludibacter sp. 221]|uniref:glycosyltransferase n=1 Tax=Paludibacter sp. 221 TaxID=2302939 RepID=UPI0013D566A4|nr:glycosyltransferase [Paludibacter sp. 221]NDV47176.1 glycosyltransferase [Paludibacter sp. 221]